jgi:large subunit ribosomal protein L10
MRAEKQFINKEYLARLNASPFFIVVDYRGLKVAALTELRKRLRKAGAELHVVKNSIFRVAVKEAAIADLGTSLTGQMAVVTGQKDISAAAKTVKTFTTEFDKPKIKFGYLKSQRIEAVDVLALADLPSIEVLRGKIIGLLNAPAGRLIAVLNAPGAQLARVLNAHSEQSAPPQ